MNIATPNDTAMSESCGRFSPIEEILDELRAGRMIVLVDDEHRENEGDLRTLTPARTSPPALPRATAPARCYACTIHGDGSGICKIQKIISP